MPRKKKIPGTISQDEGIEKLKVIKESLPSPLPDSQGEPGDKPKLPEIQLGAEPAPKPVSGIFRSLYPLVIDLLCHVANKEKFSDARKADLLESVSQDLDELERRYIPETVQNMPGVKALSITGLAIAFQPKAKKEPVKEPEPPQKEPEKKPEQPAPAAPIAESAPTIPQPGQAAQNAN